jgi:hypothetical protein
MRMPEIAGFADILIGKGYNEKQAPYTKSVPWASSKVIIIPLVITLFHLIAPVLLSMKA